MVEQNRLEAREEGIKIGEARGKISTLYALVQDGTFTWPQAAAKAKMTVSEFRHKVQALAI